MTGNKYLNSAVKSETLGISNLPLLLATLPTQRTKNAGEKQTAYFSWQLYL